MLLMVAYGGAIMITVAPLAQAAPHEMSGAIAMKAADDTGEKMPMPCSKSMKSGCFTELGCVFMVSLPATHPVHVTMISWSSVTYTITAEFPQEYSIKPALGPPISRA